MLDKEYLYRLSNRWTLNILTSWATVGFIISLTTEQPLDSKYLQRLSSCLILNILKDWAAFGIKITTVRVLDSKYLEQVSSCVIQNISEKWENIGFEYIEKLNNCWTLHRIVTISGVWNSLLLTFKLRIKSHLPFAGIIRSSPYSPRFQIRVKLRLFSKSQKYIMKYK